MFDIICNESVSIAVTLKNGNAVLKVILFY